MTGPIQRVLMFGAASPLLDALARRAEAEGARVTRVAETSEAALERAMADASADEGPAAVVLGLDLADPVGPVGGWSLAAWDEAVPARLRTAFVVARLAVEEFLGTGEGGRILYLASTGPADGVVHGALSAFVRSVAKEYGAKGVGCNAVLVEPGSPADADRAAGTAWLLLAPAGAYVTGEVVRLGAVTGPNNR